MSTYSKDGAIDKIIQVLLNIVPLTAQNQQIVKQKLNVFLNEFQKSIIQTDQEKIVKDLKSQLEQQQNEFQERIQSQEQSFKKQREEDRQLQDSLSERTQIQKLQTKIQYQIEEKMEAKLKDSTTVMKNKDIINSNNIDQLNEQIRVLSEKLNDSQIKFDEIQKQRKEDKEKYRLQYEQLKQKGQDKIHRLKDIILEYQTNLQAMELEMTSLKDLLVNEQEHKVKLQEMYDEELKKQNEKFELQQRRKENELKREMLDIQKDLSDKIEILRSQVDIQPKPIEQNELLFRQSYPSSLVERINQLTLEKSELEDVIKKQSNVIELMSSEQEQAFKHYENLLEQKTQRIDELKESKEKPTFQQEKLKLREVCKYILALLSHLREIRELFIIYAQEFAEIINNSRQQSRPRNIVSNFESSTNTMAQTGTFGSISEDNGKLSYQSQKSITDYTKQRLLSFDDQYKEQVAVFKRKIQHEQQLKTSPDPLKLDNRRYCSIKHSHTQSTIPSPKRSLYQRQLEILNSIHHIDNTKQPIQSYEFLKGIKQIFTNLTSTSDTKKQGGIQDKLEQALRTKQRQSFIEYKTPQAHQRKFSETSHNLLNNQDPKNRNFLFQTGNQLRQIDKGIFFYKGGSKPILYKKTNNQTVNKPFESISSKLQPTHRSLLSRS